MTASSLERTWCHVSDVAWKQDWAWESAQDPNSGQVYFINTKSDETTWEKPARWDEYLALYGEPGSTYDA